MHTMDKYTDADGKELTLLALVKKEPAWAANVIGSLKIKLKEAEQRADRAERDAKGGDTMNKEQKLAALQNWQTAYKNLDAAFDLLKPALGYLGEGALWDAVWFTFERYTEVMSDLVGDDSGWLNWYCYENDMGAKGYGAGYGEDLRPIEDLDDLLWLIEEGIKNDPDETLV